MKKRTFLNHTIWIIILIIVGLMVVLWLLKAPIIASYLSNKLGVNVSIGSINVSKSGMNIQSFKVNNPSGSRTHTAFSSKDIHVTYQWKDLTGDPNIIQEISIDDVFLGIEFYNLTGSENNWTKILESVAEEKSKERDNEVIVRKLIITNLSVQIRGKGLFESWEKVKDIKRIEFANVSSKKGFPTGELIKEIFDEADIQKYLQDVLKPKKWLEKIFSERNDYLYRKSCGTVV